MLALALLMPSCRRSANPPRVSGTIEVDQVHVGSRYGGRVEKINAAGGNSLTNGQIIVELDAAELAEFEAGPRHEEIAAAKNDWESQAADLELARSDARRARELFTQKTISETERDSALSRAAVLEKSVAAAKSRYDLLLAGTRHER